MVAMGIVHELLGTRREASGATPMRLVEEVRRGIPFARAERAYKRLGFTLEETAASIGVSARTLHRRKAGREKLDSTESEKVLRLVRVGGAAIDVFGDEELARRWLREPNRALGGVTPASLLDTDVGAQAVVDVLTRIEFGVYS